MNSNVRPLVYLFFALVLVVAGAAASPGDIADVPFAALTLKMLLGSIVSWGCYIAALYNLVLSLGQDRVWPWRWTLRYFGNLVGRGAFGALFCFGAYAFAEKKQLDGWALTALLVGLGILLLFTFFSSEFEFFKEGSENRKDEKAP